MRSEFDTLVMLSQNDEKQVNEKGSNSMWQFIYLHFLSAY